jgi:hypothetical protein
VCALRTHIVQGDDPVSRQKPLHAEIPLIHAGNDGFGIDRSNKDRDRVDRAGIERQIEAGVDAHVVGGLRCARGTYHVSPFVDFNQNLIEASSGGGFIRKTTLPLLLALGSPIDDVIHRAPFSYRPALPTHSSLLSKRVFCFLFSTAVLLSSSLEDLLQAS